MFEAGQDKGRKCEGTCENCCDFFVAVFSVCLFVLLGFIFVCFLVFKNSPAQIEISNFLSFLFTLKKNVCLTVET